MKFMRVKYEFAHIQERLANLNFNNRKVFRLCWFDRRKIFFLKCKVWKKEVFTLNLLEFIFKLLSKDKTIVVHPEILEVIEQSREINQLSTRKYYLARN